MAEIASEVRMANDNPAKQIQVTMRQGKEADDTDAVVRVADDNPVQYAIVADNTGNATTGRDRLGFAFHDANLFNLDHVLSAQLQTSMQDPSQVLVFGANYLIPLYSQGETVDFSLGYSNVNSGLVTTTAGSYGISGSGTTFGARLTQFLGRSESLDARVFEELDYRAYTNDVTAGTSGPSLVPDATVHPIDLGYALTYKQKDLTIDAGLTYIHNIPGGPRGTSEDFEQPGGRSGATASYQMLRYQATLAYNLAHDWRLHLAMNGQATRDALIAPEQFGAGGLDSVRGFDEREAIEDRGIRGSVDVETPDAGKRWIGEAWQLRGVVFYDCAHLDRNLALPGEVNHEMIDSAGIGVRLTYANNLSLRVDFAEVLDGAGLRPDHSNMLHFSALWAF
jgi:hemolysin activation/secretion protein